MNKRLRIVIDSGMVLLLPLLMAYSLVGEAAHEYLGIEMSLLFVTHHILNVAWWKHLLRGKYTPIRILGTVINLALVVIMLALPISGMILSRYVFRSLNLGLSCRFGQHTAEVHRTSCALVFALIRVRKHWWDDITQGKQ